MENATDLITTGCHVEVNLVDRSGNKEHLSFDIVQDKAADFSKGLLSESTPLAQALLNEKAGTIIPYLKDDIFAIEILVVAPSTLEAQPNSEEKRKAKLQQAMREVERTNAVVFASSFSGKWGDYDPDSIPKDDKKVDESDQPQKQE